MSGLNTTFGGIGWAIGRLEFWNWFLSVDCVVKLANRKHIFGNFSGETEMFNVFKFK